ncbi:MAG: tetratricopeptide repeat protein [Parvularculaceae bacterium]
MRFVIAALAASALLAAPAHAASTIDRVRALEAEVGQLKSAAAAAAERAARIDIMEQELRELTGRVEELTFKLRQAEGRIESMSAILAGESGFENFDGGGAPASGAFGAPDAGGGPTVLGGPSSGRRSAPASRAAPDAASSRADIDAAAAPEVPLPLDPEAAFHYANGFVLQRDFPRAEAAFTLFLEAFGDHPRAADAQFRLGEIHLATQDDAKAAAAFIKHIQTYPNDQRSAQAHLKLGTAFARLDQRKDACDILNKTKAKFPDAGDDVIGRADRELRRYECG